MYSKINPDAVAKFREYDDKILVSLKPHLSLEYISYGLYMRFTVPNIFVIHIKNTLYPARMNNEIRLEIGQIGPVILMCTTKMPFIFKYVCINPLVLTRGPL